MNMRSLTFALLLFSFTGFSQKEIDLKLLNVYTDSTSLISDTIYSSFDFAVPLEYFIEFTNQGVNSITQNDTILFHYYVNGVKKTFDTSVYPPTDSIPFTGFELQSNDTMLLRVIVFNNYRSYANENDGIIDECFELIPSVVDLNLNELTPADNIICYDRNVVIGLSTENEKKIVPLEIYPNPSSDYIYSNYPLKGIQFYNISGQQIDDFIQVNQFKIDISRLEKGVYFIKGIWDATNFTRKIVLR